jgi:hypothetical protein
MAILNNPVVKTVGVVLLTLIGLKIVKPYLPAAITNWLP